MAITVSTVPIRKVGTNDGRPTLISLSMINILPQMRTVFNPNYIKELSLNIDKEGVMQAPGVAQHLSRRSCEKFLEIFNRVKRTSLTAKGLKSIGKTYTLLIFGECRIRALRLIWENGKPTLEGFESQQFLGEYFLRRFGADQVDVNCYNGIDALDALGKQLSENAYKAPSPWERAVADTELFTYRIIRAEMKGSRYSLAQFAREEGKSEDVLRASIQWTNFLPEDTKELVRTGQVPFGISNQLVRAWLWGEKHLEDSSERKQFYDALVLDAVTKRLNVASFTALVGSVIRQRARDQQSLAEGQFELSTIMQEASSNINRLANRKKELSRNTEHDLRSMCMMVRCWTTYLQSGRLKPTHSPLLAGAVRRQVITLTELLCLLLETGEWLASEETRRQVVQLSVEIPACMAEIERFYPDRDEILVSEA